jgi:hypothetical protein
VDVVGSPLTRHAVVRTWEPVVILRAIRWAERTDGIAAEEMSFLVDVGTREDIGVRTDGIEPPGRPCLLGTDAHEVRRSCDLARLGSWRSGVESVLPWCVLADGMKD